MISVNKLVSLIGLIIGYTVTLSAQFDKANTLFKEKSFAAAIPYFETGLAKNDNIVAKSRLAFCYRMLNKIDKAEATYAQVVLNEKARKDTWLYYAEALMSNEKYDSAKVWFLNYYNSDKSDSTGLRMAEACDLVKTIPPYFNNISIEEFYQNSAADDNTPVLFDGGLVFTSDRPSGIALLKKKSDWTGRDFLKLWYSRYNAEKGVFEEPESFSSKINELNKNTANASFSADWNTIVFCRNSGFASKKDAYNLQLYRLERSPGGKWHNEDRLDFCNPEVNYMHPCLSPDGKMIFFASDANGRGGFDIFYSKKTAKGWGKVQNAGPMVNTSGHEAFPYFHRDGRLFFASKGHPGYGGFDIFVSQWDTVSNQFLAARNLGRPLNSPLDDFGFFLAANDSTGCFTSGRSGGDDDVFLFWLGNTKNLVKLLYPNGVPANDAHGDSLGMEDRLETDTDSVPTLFPVRKNDSVPEYQNAGRVLDFSTFLQDVHSAGLTVGTVYSLNAITYDSVASVELPASAQPLLDTLTALFKLFPSMELEICSHTEGIGDAKRNMKTSRLRASGLAAALLSRGVSPDQIKSKGYGSKKPLNGCKSEPDCLPEEHLMNRRTELRVLNWK